MTLVPVLFIAHLALVKKITKSVLRKASLTLMILQSQLMKTVNSLKNALFIKEFMLRMLIRSSSKTSNRKEELFKVVLKFTTIHSAGEVILL